MVNSLTKSPTQKYEYLTRLSIQPDSIYVHNAAVDLYSAAQGKLKPGEYVDFTCVVQGIQHVVCHIQELPGNCLCLITVIEDGLTHIIYAPAEQVFFQIVHGRDETPQLSRSR